MRFPSSLAAMLMLAATSTSAQEDLRLSDPLPMPPSGRIEDGNGEFALEVSVDPLAGQRLDAGEFVLELQPPQAAPDELMRNGFESP